MRKIVEQKVAVSAPNLAEKLEESRVYVRTNELTGGGAQLAANLNTMKATDHDCVLLLGDLVADFEDALLRNDLEEAAQYAVRVAWCARACGLRRGDVANTQLATAVILDSQVTTG